MPAWKRFWKETGRAARSAIIATVVFATLTVIGFVVLVVEIVRTFGISVGQAIFGPPFDGPLVFLSFAVPAILLQGLVATALRQRLNSLRIIGVVGALGITAISAAFLIAVGADVVVWLSTGFVHDVGDFAGEIAATPLAVALGALNLRAARLGIGDVRGRERSLIHEEGRARAFDSDGY
jgi:hypothetical protein